MHLKSPRRAEISASAFGGARTKVEQILDDEGHAAVKRLVAEAEAAHAGGKARGGRADRR